MRGSNGAGFVRAARRKSLPALAISFGTGEILGRYSLKTGGRDLSFLQIRQNKHKVFADSEVADFRSADVEDRRFCSDLSE